MPARRRARQLHWTAIAGTAVFAVSGFTSSPEARAAAFTAGDLVTYRVGDGTATLANTGNTVFLDEYTPTGTLVQSIQLANTGTNALIASGTATSEGMINLSANGQYLAVPGYNTAPSATTIVSGAAPRAVAIFDATGSVVSQTNLTDFSAGNNPRSAVPSNDGQSFYVAGGAGGVRYATVGATTSIQLSTTVTNLRNVNITAGQLYVSDNSGSAVRLGTVGTGTPTTTGQTITNIPGFPTSTGSPYQFAFTDLSPTVPGVDTLYVADDASSTGIQKYSLVSGNWTLKGTILGTIGVRGLTISLAADGATVNIFGATGGSTATGGGSIFAYADASGYNNFTSGATAATIATATANEAFRGIAFVPTSVPEPTTVLGGVLLLGAAGWSQRRRLRGSLLAA